MLSLAYMRYALAAAALVGLLAPAVGFFLVHRRLSLVGDGIGHIAFAGVALGLLLHVPPLWTAMVAAAVGALLLERLRKDARLPADQALALVFYSGIALGVVLVSAAGQMNVGLYAFLFGSLLTVGPWEIGLLGALTLLALLALGALYRPLVAAILDEEGAAVSGVPVERLNAFLALLAALTVTAGMRAVGILLVAALMVVPVLTGTALASSLRGALLLSLLSGVVGTLAGLTFAYYADLAPGGAIVLASVSLFGTVLLALRALPLARRLAARGA